MGQKTIDTTAEVIIEHPKAVVEPAIAENVTDEPKCKYATQEEAVERLKLLFESNVFTDEEKERFRKLWSNDWKQAISEADEAYAMKSEAMQSVA